MENVDKNTKPGKNTKKRRRKRMVKKKEKAQVMIDEEARRLAKSASALEGTKVSDWISRLIREAVGKGRKA